MIKIEIDMKMPEKCIDCRFYKEEGLFDSCAITGCLFMDDEDKQRNKNCPLMEVKEMTDKEAKDYKKLLEENLRLKNEIKNLKNSKTEKTEDTSGWDFHYNGHGSYEEQRRCFYGDFS